MIQSIASAPTRTQPCETGTAGTEVSPWSAQARVGVLRPLRLAEEVDHEAVHLRVGVVVLDRVVCGGARALAAVPVAAACGRVEYPVGPPFVTDISTSFWRSDSITQPEVGCGFANTPSRWRSGPILRMGMCFRPT